MAPRRNGCHGPVSQEQVFAWTVQPVVLIWFAIVEFGFLSGSGSPIIVSSTIWSVLLAVSLGCWLWCQLADVSRLDGVSCLVLREHDSHYCAVCKKSVPGLDHHCKWLNTCVGSRTYFAFYMLTLFAGLLFLWQMIALALLMSTWRSTTVMDRAMDVFGEPDIGFYIVTAIGIVGSAPMAWFYLALFVFHTYLYVRNMTTYDYFIEKSTRAREKRAKQKQQAQEQAKKKADAEATQKGAVASSPTLTLESQNKPTQPVDMEQQDVKAVNKAVNKAIDNSSANNFSGSSDMNEGTGQEGEAASSTNNLSGSSETNELKGHEEEPVSIVPPQRESEVDVV